MKRTLYLTVLMASFMSASACAAQDPQPPASAPAAAEAPASPETPAPAAAPEAPPTPPVAAPMPHIEINQQEKYVDVSGEVCLREGPLELLVTLRAAKEHESVFLIYGRPRNIHLALITLGLKPGSPGSWRYDNGKPIAIDPTGDALAVSVVWTDADQKVREVPIGSFARHNETGKLLGERPFVFAGSRIIEGVDGKPPTYAADATGDVVTVVSFEDEMVALPKAASNDNDALNWVVNTEATPEVGTPVKIRFRPAPKP